MNLVNVHLFVETMPFGGTGSAGMGDYYGKYGFRPERPPTNSASPSPAAAKFRWANGGLIAECFSWYGVLTTNYLGNSIEDSIWAVAFFVVGIGLGRLLPEFDGLVRVVLAIAIIGIAGYLAFLMTIDIPMYLTRWRAEVADGSKLLRPLEGLRGVSTRWVVTHDLAEWKDEMQQWRVRAPPSTTRHEASHDERRYAVGRVNERWKQNKGYFRPLFAEIANGGVPVTVIRACYGYERRIQDRSGTRGLSVDVINQRQFMNLTTFKVVLLALTIALFAIPGSRAQAPSSYELHALPTGATLHRVDAIPAEYNGRKSIKVEMPDAAIKAQLGIDVDMPTFVRIPVDFQNGTIELDVLSRLNGKGPPDARAFIGVSYRITDPEAHFETIYLRPLNGRKKNPPSPRDKRAVQYFAYPDWKFDRLRKEYPDGHYESGADIAEDEWITLRLNVDDTRVRVSVNGKDELALADTKGTPVAGGIGLWVGIGTEGYFSNLRVAPR